MAKKPEAPQAQPMSVSPEQIQSAASIGLGILNDPTTKVPMSSVQSGEATILLGLLTVLANGQCIVTPATPPEPTPAEKAAAKKAEKAAARKEKAEAKKTAKKLEAVK